ncbi:dicarboxylate/amino acid:cation symporter [Sphingomonas sp. FW199]|uniref:dicarboxylate/amino acid:cation symporter n=1 Tax=Sphingomonas sp. FW199 TaxID=3400217 RepID=UPI003CED6D86
MSQATRILAALILGLVLGVFMAAEAPGGAAAVNSVAEPVGRAWLNGLQMTVVPLVIALLVTGIAATAEAAKAGRIAARTIVTCVTLLWLSSSVGAAVTLGLLKLFPLGETAAAALKSTFAGAEPVGDVPPFSEFLVAIVPTNVLGAAVNDAFLPLILFTTVFAFAVTRLPEPPRLTLTGFFQAVADTMLIMIGWVLWLAPIGVAALAFRVGATAGTAAVGALIHYVLIVGGTGLILSLFAYPLAMFGGRMKLGSFARAILPAQVVALSTQSSLASLPAMLRASEGLGIPVARSGVILPLAVAIFRYTGPCMNLAVAIYVAHVFGVELTPAQLAAGIAAAAITTMGAVSLPGTISFISSIAPIAVAMGLPVEPLALLVAVEMLPDIVRTIGNVTADVAVTATVSARAGGAEDSGERTEADAILAGG